MSRYLDLHNNIDLIKRNYFDNEPPSPKKAFVSTSEFPQAYACLSLVI